MEKQTKELGAVAVAGRVLYELVERDANHVTLTHTQDSDQYIIINKEALPGIASILLKAAKAEESNPLLTIVAFAGKWREEKSPAVRPFAEDLFIASVDCTRRIRRSCSAYQLLLAGIFITGAISSP